jgi:hypothetical protein
MATPIESYEYQRNCSLESCNKLFGTNLKRQIFCKPTHRIIYHELKRKKTAALYKRMGKLERDLKLLAADIDKTMKKAVKEARNLAVFLSPKKGGGNSTDMKKESNG